jgi:hypothetical protein
VARLTQALGGASVSNRNEPQEENMHLANTESWTMTYDIPVELQFSAYIGQREGFQVDDTLPAQSAAEAEWRTWWETLPTRTFGIRFDNLARAKLDIPPQELLQRVDPLEQSGYSPPDFTELRSTPTLQKLCRDYWPTFHHEWGSINGTKMQGVVKLQTQLQNVGVDRVVQECVRTANRFRSRPFHFRVDFVVWPEDYRRYVSDHHLILGVQYLEPTQADILRALLKAHIARLV